MDKILIVVPVINLWDQYTIHCMESIAAQQTELPFEVLIVDNGSTDQTVEKAEDFGNRKMPGRVHILSNDRNTGCAGAWNQGVVWAQEHGFQYMLIINNDILMGPTVVDHLWYRMINPAQQHVLLVSPIDIAKEVLVPNDVLDREHAVNRKDYSESPHPSFSCFMISQETIDTVGYFDEDFYPAYFEDNDYHYRIKLANKLAIATTSCSFYHYGSRTQNQALGQPVVRSDLFEKNAAYFYRKWGGSPGYEKFSNPFNNKEQDYTYAKRR